MCYNPVIWAREQKGFTLIEAGVVVLLMGVVFFSLHPFVKNIQLKTKQDRCVENLQALSIALRSYAIDNGNAMPDDIGQVFFKGYLKNEEAFDCPFSAHKGNAKDPDYLYEKVNDFWIKENKPLIYDKPGNHTDNADNILFSNGDIDSRSAMAEKPVE